MTEKYKQFLAAFGVISEEEFTKVINSLPDVNIDEVFSEQYSEYNNLDDIAYNIIASILDNWNSVYPDNVDFNNKIFELNDVNSVDDLEEIKDTFKGWTISNYDELKEELLEEERCENNYTKKRNYCDLLFNNLTLEEIEKLLKQYGIKK